MKLLFEQRAEWREERKAERERMPAEEAQWEAEVEKMVAERRPTLQSSNDHTMFSVVDPEQYCGRISELHKFLCIVPGSFESHSHIFPHVRPNQVQYVLNFLGSWSSHVNPTPRNTKMEDPMAWGRKRLKLNHPVMNDFHVFNPVILKTYSDMDREMQAAVWG